MAKQEVSIIEAFARATEADLSAIDTEIASRRDQIKQLESEIYGLSVMRKTIDVKLHGKPARKVKAKRAAAPTIASNDDSDREKIFDWLSKHGVAAKPGVIGAALGIHHLRVKSLCQHQWFEESLAGFSIA